MKTGLPLAEARGSVLLSAARRTATVSERCLAFRGAIIAVAVSLLFPALAQAQEPPRLSATARLVIAPVTVTDRDGHYAGGLEARDFVLLDNGRERRFDLDVTYFPISLVIAVQTNGASAAAIHKAQRVGSLIEPLVIGAHGEAAVVGFDDQVRVLQSFTPDIDAVAGALNHLAPRGDGAHMLDAVAESVRMLAGRPAPRRRVLLLISEAKDRGSKTKLEDAVSLAQRENVPVYALTYSVFTTPFTAKAGTLPQTGPFDLLAVFKESRQAAKRNAGGALARYTGAERIGFTKQRGLEAAVSRIGEELHSQYLLSFAPEPGEDVGFRTIEVRLRGHPELVVRTRPGYWIAPPGSL